MVEETTMLYKLAFGCTLLLGLYGTSCHEQQVSPETRSKELVGTYELLIRSSCKNYYPIRSDTMVLYPDGTFDQHVVAKDGKVYDSHGQLWAYMEKDSVSLDKRIDWDNCSDPADRTGTKETQIPLDLKRVSQGEVLIVHFGPTPEILLNPDSDCVYVKTR